MDAAILRSRAQDYFLPFVVVVLLLIALVVFHAQASRSTLRELRVSFLDVGQGDSIFIESPTGTQVIVDGGPDSSVLRELSSVMDPFDRSIDAIIVTNPDQDHFAGFLNVLSRYTVGKEFEPGTKKTTVTYHALESALREGKVPRVVAKRGMVLDLGGGASLEVLYPDRDVSNLKPNDGSIVMKLVYGKTSVMLMGDATSFVEYHLLSLGDNDKAGILKLGHHGSKTSSSPGWIKKVAPREAIISAGCKNRYGHPTKEVLDRLSADNVPYLWTCKAGTISYVSDGSAWTLQ